ncbi:MAG: respiratory nitrate reductase subunit gamma [Bacillota bacterium]
MSIVQWLCYVSLLVLVVGLAARTLRYARAPMHLRWELYPVPHEVGKPYGGSYFEEPDWWTHPRKTSFVGELRVMLSEIFLHAGLWHHNRKMWVVSYPFHLGIYLVAIFLVLLLAGGAVQAAGGQVTADSGGVLTALYYLSLAAGPAGMVMVIVGGLGVLARRLGDPTLRSYSAPADYFNVSLILALALTWFLTWLFVDRSFALARAFVRDLLIFAPVARAHPAVLVEMSLLSVFLIYLPFTHMTHFIGKWFTYHLVRWDDRPNLGSGYEKSIADVLSRPLGWSAPHISNPQEKKTWAEVTGEVE